MVQAYTPGLAVKEHAVVEKVRRLPLRGDVTVREGDRVRAETVVARTELPGEVVPMNAAALLSLDPAELPARLGKGPGDPVREGEILAWSRGFFGLFKQPLRSPVTGTVDTVSRVTGQLILRRPPVPVEMPAYVDGRVMEVFPGEGVRIRAHAALVQGIFGIGGEARGVISLKAAAPEERVPAGAITPEDAGKILVAGAFLSAEAFLRAVEMGVAGIVTGGVGYGSLKRILGREVGVAITGAENVGTTLVVTEGFGVLPMAERTFALLARHAGRRASMSGATQIRAGVVRPEVVVPFGEGDGPETAQPAHPVRGLEVGRRVRVVRGPRFGAVGRVTALPVEPERMESEILSRVVMIRVESGEEITLPRANVEILDL